MKSGERRKSSVSKEVFNKIKFSNKIEPDYDEFKKVIKAMNRLRAAEVVNCEEGHNLPYNIGKLIILKRKTNKKKLYSMTRPGTQIFNFHSFGWIYKIHHKERILMRYPELYKFRPNRPNIKVPLYNNIMEGEKDYFKYSDFFN